ncbi:MAG TPA: PKD domain-containing protein, partial [Cytophagaceae bacterium]
MSLKKPLLVILSYLFLMVGNEAKASNFSAADMTFKCLGGNKYEFTLTLFSDCGQAKNIPDSAKIEYNAVTCGQNNFFYIKKLSEEIVSSCKTEKSQCEGGTKPGFYKSVYVGNFSLPLTCTDWVFSWQRCFRDKAITNIGNEECIYIETTINNKAVGCNGSPRFINEPLNLPYLNTDYTVNFSAIDGDGDRLEYSIVPPKSGLSSDVNYRPGFNPSNPLTSLPVATFNSKTGELKIHPTKLERTVVAVKVKEFRNNILISSVTRDLVIAVIDGSNVSPVVTGIEPSGTTEIQANANTEICFNVSASDANAGQLVELDWDKSITGASFTPGAASATPSAKFCWTPQDSDIGTKTFTVFAKDNACPPTTSQKIITIKVLAPLCKLKATYSVNGFCFNGATKIAVGSIEGTPVSWEWDWGNGKKATTKDPGSMTYESPGDYTIKLTMKDATGCPYVSNRKITICSPPEAAFNVKGQCEKNPITVEETSPKVTGCTITNRVLT